MGWTAPGRIVGIAGSPEEALRACEAAGFTVIGAGEGGNLDTYDADDAPRVHGFPPDGIGAFGVTVEPAATI
jgi:hypothetical protein